MSQYDVVLKYASRAAAIADLAEHTGVDDQSVREFFGDRAIPNVKLWRASQDVGDVHTYLVGYFVLISLPRLVPALRDNAAVQLVIDRDKANARQAGAIIRSTVGQAVLQDIRMSPVFAGSDFPFGAWQ